MHIDDIRLEPPGNNEFQYTSSSESDSEPPEQSDSETESTSSSEASVESRDGSQCPRSPRDPAVAAQEREQDAEDTDDESSDGEEKSAENEEHTDLLANQHTVPQASAKPTPPRHPSAARRLRDKAYVKETKPEVKPPQQSSSGGVDSKYVHSRKALPTREEEEEGARSRVHKSQSHLPRKQATHDYDTITVDLSHTAHPVAISRIPVAIVSGTSSDAEAPNHGQDEPSGKGIHGTTRAQGHVDATIPPDDHDALTSRDVLQVPLPDVHLHAEGRAVQNTSARATSDPAVPERPRRWKRGPRLVVSDRPPVREVNSHGREIVAGARNSDDPRIAESSARSTDDHQIDASPFQIDLLVLLPLDSLPTIQIPNVEFEIPWGDLPDLF